MTMIISTVHPYGLTQVIKSATRVSKERSSLIDIILTHLLVIRTFFVHGEVNLDKYYEKVGFLKLRDVHVVVGVC